jgi:hypothetical protein
MPISGPHAHALALAHAIDTLTIQENPTRILSQQAEK